MGQNQAGFLFFQPRIFQPDAVDPADNSNSRHWGLVACKASLESSAERPVWHKSRHKALKATYDSGLFLNKYWLRR
jgi:hypothetical protein